MDSRNRRSARTQRGRCRDADRRRKRERSLSRAAVLQVRGKVTAAFLLGIIGASAVGSIHCMAMCGPLVGLHGGAKSMRLAITHSLGRLTTYALLGAAAGLLGGALDLAG